MNERKRSYVFNQKIDRYFTGIHHGTSFAARIVADIFKTPFHFSEVIRQSFELGIKSLPLITLTGFITGLVFTKQSRQTLEAFGATSWLPSLISIAIVRALGSLVTGLICAGKIGSSIGAELGSMRVTEQIDAMEVSATGPFKYLVVTRVLATTLVIPVLSLYCSFVGLMGSFVNVNTYDMTSFTSFIKHGFETITFLDIFTSVTKSIVFGFTIGTVACYKGYFADKGTKGVGLAANQAVVTSMFFIFIEEVIIVQISNWMK